MQKQATMMADAHQAFKTGELLVKEGLIHPDDVGTALAIQEKRHASVSLNKSRYIGMILCDLNLITPIDNFVVLHKYNKLVTLSSAMVEKKLVTLEQMQSLEQQSLREDIPLISLLLKTQTVSLQGLQQILFNLFHIPFKSISDFIFNEKQRPVLTQILDRHASKENGIIPLVHKDNTVLFGLTAPENLLLIHQMNREFPQYRFKALFIPFSGFTWFHDIIYPVPDEAGPPLHRPEPPDVSLMLSFKMKIQDPRADGKAIQALYNRYETLRTLLGHAKKGDRQKEFKQFIRQVHQRMAGAGRHTTVEFSFQKQAGNLVILAELKE